MTVKRPYWSRLMFSNFAELVKILMKKIQHNSFCFISKGVFGSIKSFSKFKELFAEYFVVCQIFIDYKV